MIKRAETDEKDSAVLGLPFLRSKILRINFEHPSIEIISLLRVNTFSKSSIKYELGMDIVRNSDDYEIVIQSDWSVILKMTIDIFIFILMIT